MTIIEACIIEACIIDACTIAACNIERKKNKEALTPSNRREPFGTAWPPASGTTNSVRDAFPKAKIRAVSDLV